MTGGSALLVPGDSADDTQLRWVGSPSVAGPRWMKYPLVTSGMLGLQCVWTIEMSQVSPYLIDLGLSKSLMSLVFVAGPLSGLLMQPLVGIYADRSKSKFGRRRPFILVGCAVAVLGMVLLAWARGIGSIFGSAQKAISIMLAIFSVFLIDFSINAVQSTDRALLVDTLPPEEQEDGNAWAGRLSGFGAVAGFGIANLNLHEYLPIMGSTQLQALSTLTSIILVATHGLTAYSVSERILISDSRPTPTFLDSLLSIWHSYWTLRPSIRLLCLIQFFAWVGWFPTMFFTSVWVSDLYVTRATLGGVRLATDPKLFEEATRAGSRAMFFQALVAFVTACVLPFLVASEEDGIGGAGRIRERPDGWKEGLVRGIESLGIKRDWLPEVPLRWMTLPLVWAVSHAIFALAMFSTYFVSTVKGAELVLAVTGFCWAITNWAPFSILGELILSDLKSTSPTDIRLRTRTGSSIHLPIEINNSTISLGRPSRARSPRQQTLSPIVSPRRSDEEEERQLDEAKGVNAGVRSRSGASTPEDMVVISREDVGLYDEERGGSRYREEEDDEDDEEAAMESPRMGGQSTAEKAGVILGIHNVFIVIPQFLVTFLSSIIFYLLEPGRTVVHSPTNPTPSSTASSTPLLSRQEGGQRNTPPDAVGFIFRIGGISAIVAGFLSWKLMRDLKRTRYS